MDLDVTRCKGTCGRLLRPAGSDPKLYPKDKDGKPLRAIAKAGKCSMCYKHEHFGQKSRWRMPEQCYGCRRPLRPCGTTLEEFPDTYQHRGRGYCWACWVDNDPVSPPRHQQRQPRPETCQSCGRKLRNKRGAKMPGTVIFAGRGMCSTCYAADLEDRDPRPLVPVLEQRAAEVDPATAANIVSLRNYLAGRQRQRAS